MITLEYYTDSKMKNKIPVNEMGQPLFDWGDTVPGERREKTFYIKNTTPDTITLRQPHTNDEDFSIKDYPTQLKGYSSGVMKLEFTPAYNRIKPLNADFGFEKIIG